MRGKLKVNRKGSLQDLLLVMVLLLVLAITIVFSSLIAHKIGDTRIFSDELTGTNQSVARGIFDKTLNNTIPKFDTIFVGFLIAGILGTIILAFAVRSLTVFFMAGFIFTAVLILIAPILSNVYDAVADNEQVIEFSAPFTAIEFVMSNLPLMMLIAATAVSVVIYGMWRLGV